MNLARLIYLCFAIYFFWNFKQQKEQKIFLESVHQQDLMTVETLEERMYEMWDKTARDLYDYRKKKYRPILIAFRDIQDHFEHLNHQIDSLEQFDETASVVVVFERTLDRSFDTYENLLNEFGTEVFGFKQDEIVSRLNNIQAYFDHNSPQYNSNSPIVNFSYLKTKAKLLEHHLLKEITGYYSGRVICGGPILFPVVVPKKSTPFIGENFEARIGIGQYSNQIDPASLRYIINGDTIPANLEDGTTEIAIPTTKIGTQKVDITFEVINPMTGKKSDYHSMPYEYVVLPK